MTGDTNSISGGTDTDTLQTGPSLVELPKDEPVTLKSGASEITLQAAESTLYIRSLTTAQGTNVAADDSEYSLPYIIERDSKNYTAVS